MTAQVKMREWFYILPPDQYGISCDRCAGSDLSWSDIAGLIWCNTCGFDTWGTEGIFDGPVPMETVKRILGPRCFYRFNVAKKQIEYPITRGRITYYRRLNVKPFQAAATL